VRLSVQVPHGLQITATLTGYAYETEPNKPIIAGKTKGDGDDMTSGEALVLADEFGDSAAAVIRVPMTAEPASLGALALGARGRPIVIRAETKKRTPARPDAAESHESETGQ
jgi:hypothetical protein